MFKVDFIKDGYKPLFALIEDSFINAATSQIQMNLFNKRVGYENIKTQILQSDGTAFLVVLYIKDEDDNDSLKFVLDSLVSSGNIIEAHNIKLKSN